MQPGVNKIDFGSSYIEVEMEDGRWEMRDVDGVTVGVAVAVAIGVRDLWRSYVSERIAWASQSSRQPTRDTTNTVTSGAQSDTDNRPHMLKPALVLCIMCAAAEDAIIMP